MIATLRTGIGDVDLCADPYALVAFDLGDTPKNMVWFQPPILGTIPQLAISNDGPIQMQMTLRLMTSSAVDMQDAVNQVIGEFTDSNTVTYSIGATDKTIATFPSNIEPLDLGDEEKLYVAAFRYVLPRWTFSVWRAPYLS